MSEPFYRGWSDDRERLSLSIDVEVMIEKGIMEGNLLLQTWFKMKTTRAVRIHQKGGLYAWKYLCFFCKELCFSRWQLLKCLPHLGVGMDVHLGDSLGPLIGYSFVAGHRWLVSPGILGGTATSGQRSPSCLLSQFGGLWSIRRTLISVPGSKQSTIWSSLKIQQQREPTKYTFKWARSGRLWHSSYPSRNNQLGFVRWYLFLEKFMAPGWNHFVTSVAPEAVLECLSGFSFPTHSSDWGGKEAFGPMDRQLRPPKEGPF